MLLRHDGAAAALLVLMLTVWDTLGTGGGIVGGIGGLVIYSIIVLVIMRLGILAFAASDLAYSAVGGFPVTTDPSAWYWGIGLAGVMLLFALAGYGFYTSLGGQPVFGRASTEG